MWVQSTQTTAGKRARHLTLYSVLHIASSEGFLEVVETILLHRNKLQRAKLQVLDIDLQDDYSLTPLMMAASNGHLEIVKLLLKFGANPRMKN